jgi:hypothetical protein
VILLIVLITFFVKYREKKRDDGRWTKI